MLNVYILIRYIYIYIVYIVSSSQHLQYNQVIISSTHSLSKLHPLFL